MHSNYYAEYNVAVHLGLPAHFNSINHCSIPNASLHVYTHHMHNLLDMLQSFPALAICLQVHWDLPSSEQWEEHPMLLFCQYASASGKGCGRRPPLHCVCGSPENCLLLQLEYSGRSTLPSTCLQPLSKSHSWDHSHMGGTVGRLRRKDSWNEKGHSIRWHTWMVTMLCTQLPIYSKCMVMGQPHI